MKLTVYRLIGILFVVAGIIGYFTVADELRHVGEFIAVTDILIAGLVFLTVDSGNVVSKRYSVQWVGIGILAGAIAGAGIDNMYIGTLLGLLLGIAPALLSKKMTK